MIQEQEQEAKEDGCQLLIWNFPRKLKNKFKIKCLEQDVTMRETVIYLLKKYIYD